MERTDDHDADVRVLVGRLNTGWTVCEQETDVDRKARLEDHWIALLHQYEALGDPAEPQFSDPIKRGSTP